MNANGLYSGVEGYVIPGTNSGVGGGVANGVYGEVSDSFVYDLPKCIFWLDPGYGLNVSNLGPISSWKDKFDRYTYIQENSAAQPRLNPQDASFNNNPVIDFNTTGKGLFTTNGPQLSGNLTLVMVYQYLSPAQGSSYQSRVISDGDESNARSAGMGYLWNKNNNSNFTLAPGYWGLGSTLAFVSTTLYNTNRYIIVINRNLWLANNQNVTITTGALSNIPSFRLNAVGGLSTNQSGVFKLGEVLLYDYLMDFTQASFISNRLNSKYQIY